jgi:hypothetical protein
MAAIESMTHEMLGLVLADTECRCDVSRVRTGALAQYY